MSLSKGLFSSNSSIWATPQDFFDNLNGEFHFTLDVCALPSNAKCKEYYTPEDDGLSKTWQGRCYMNPPYGREIIKWVEKAYTSVKNGEADICVCLLPARTDTRWFQNFCLKSNDIRFVKGRLHFSGCKDAAPFPSCVVVFSEDSLKDNGNEHFKSLKSS